MTKKQRAIIQKVEDAYDIVDDDMSDGVWWAMMGELTGLDVGKITWALKWIQHEAGTLKYTDPAHQAEYVRKGSPL